MVRFKCLQNEENAVLIKVNNYRVKIKMENAILGK